jgi:hypothetical protein
MDGSSEWRPSDITSSERGVPNANSPSGRAIHRGASPSHMMARPTDRERWPRADHHSIQRNVITEYALRSRVRPRHGVEIRRVTRRQLPPRSPSQSTPAAPPCRSPPDAGAGGGAYRQQNGSSIRPRCRYRRSPSPLASVASGGSMTHFARLTGVHHPRFAGPRSERKVQPRRAGPARAAAGALGCPASAPTFWHGTNGAICRSGPGVAKRSDVPWSRPANRA